MTQQIIFHKTLKSKKRTYLPFFFPFSLTDPSPQLCCCQTHRRRKEGGGSEAMPIFLSCTLACMQATVTLGNQVKPLCHQILDKYYLHARKQTQCYFVFLSDAGFKYRGVRSVLG